MINESVKKSTSRIQVFYYTRWNSEKKRCRDYVGVACVNGRCPAAIREKYEEECIPVVIRCHNCFFYRGCEDCALADTDW